MVAFFRVHRPTAQLCCMQWPTIAAALAALLADEHALAAHVFLSRTFRHAYVFAAIALGTEVCHVC